MERINVLFPIIFNSKKGIGENQKRLNMVLPLYWSYKSKYYNRLITPLFYQNKKKNGDSNFSILYFLFRKSKMGERKSTSIIWPICETTKDTNLKYFRFAPIFWSKKTHEYKYFSIQPFYYQSKNTEYKSYRILWQLFTYKNYYNKKKSRNFLWKTIFWDTYDNKDYEFRILHLLFANTNKNGKVEKSLFPLYQFSKDTKGNRSLFMFFYFYHSLKREIPNTTEFYQEEKIFWFIRLRSNKKYLENKGVFDY